MNVLKKILIITYYWPPSGGAGVQRWLKFAKYLPEFGYEVHVLTVNAETANYPQLDESLLSEVPQNIHVHTTKTSDPYVIYSLFGRTAPSSGFANETVHGISGLVKKLARFIRGNMFIPDPRKGWNQYAIKKANELIDTHGIDMVVTTSPPHSTQLIGLELKKTRNIKWVADMRDPWTKIYYVSELLQTKWAKNRNVKLERAVLENANRVITVSQSLAGEFCELAPRLKQENVEVIPNGFDEDDFQFDIPFDKQFTIGYMGTITDQYDVTALLKTVGSIEVDIAFRFIGDVPTQFRNRIEEVSTKTEFTGYLNHDQAIEKAAACSVLLLVIPKIENNKGILTGKIFEYLALNRPILGIGPADGDAAAILNETGTGKMFDYADETGIRQFMEEQLKHFQETTISLKTSHVGSYSRRALTKKLDVVLRSLD
jgi:glycosyltransferase involved in cell wall biosynthesis